MVYLIKIQIKNEFIVMRSKIKYAITRAELQNIFPKADLGEIADFSPVGGYIVKIRQSFHKKSEITIFISIHY